MKKQRYLVNAKFLDFWVDLEVLAESLDDATEQAKELTVEDFVTIHGDWIDGQMQIIGVIKS